MADKPQKTNTSTQTRSQEHKVDPVWMTKWGKALKNRNQQGIENREQGIVNSEQEVISSGQQEVPKSQSWLERWQAKKITEEVDEQEQEKQALLAMGENLDQGQGTGGIVQRKSLKEFLRTEENNEQRVESREQLNNHAIQRVSRGGVSEISVQVGNDEQEDLGTEKVGGDQEAEIRDQEEGVEGSEQRIENNEKNEGMKRLKNESEIVESEQATIKKSFWRVRPEVVTEKGIECPWPCLGLAVLFGILSVLSSLALLIGKFWIEYSLDQQILLVTTIFGFVATYGFYQMKVWLPPFFLFTFVWGIGKDLLFFYLGLTTFSVVGFFVSFAIQGAIMLYLVYKRDLFRY